jgi:hypothetical protein
MTGFPGMGIFDCRTPEMNPNDLDLILMNKGLAALKIFLDKYPQFSINSIGSHGRAAIHAAANLDDKGEALKFILSRYNVDVNLMSRNVITGQPDAAALHCACIQCYNPSNPNIMRLLLEDKRTDIQILDDKGKTPLWNISNWGNLEALEAMIAFRNPQELNLDHRAEFGGSFQNVIETSIRTKVAPLLKRFQQDPVKTKREVRHKMFDVPASRLFALIVFLCDDLLQFKLPFDELSKTVRFLMMAQRLPIELQMLLCYRAGGSSKQNILSGDSEMAFRDLAKNYQ